MLEISETEAGVAQFAKKEVNMAGVIRDACELFRPIAEEKGVLVILELPDTVCVSGDVHMLQRMIVNLLENAIKYTPSGGRVVISLNDDKDQVAISIHDTGIGISENDLPHIFKRLYRCDSSRSQKGFGLGLSLARAIARAHGGDIIVKSDSGKGSVFTVTLLH
jgi:signal transduction histidine kinase